MVSVLASSAVDRGFESGPGQTKDYNIDICCFSAKYVAFKSKSKDCLARCQAKTVWLGVKLRLFGSVSN